MPLPGCSQGVGRAGIPSEAQQGEDVLPSVCGGWQDSSPVDYWMEASVFRPTVSQTQPRLSAMGPLHVRTWSPKPARERCCISCKHHRSGMPHVCPIGRVRSRSRVTHTQAEERAGRCEHQEVRIIGRSWSLCLCWAFPPWSASPAKASEEGKVCLCFKL